MHPSYPQRAGERILAVLGTAALGVGAFALPAAAQAPVPTDVAVGLPSPIPADETLHAASIDIEFGDDFTPADHEVVGMLQFESDEVQTLSGTTDDGFCGMHATIPGLYCVSESTDGAINWEFEVRAFWTAPEGEYPYTFVVEVDGETVETVEGSIEVVPPDDGSETRPYLLGNAMYEGVAPGSTVDVAPEFLQEDAIADGAEAVVVTTWAPEYLPHGLAWPGADYDNCIETEGVNVVCVVTDFEDLPGTVFTFDTPIGYTVDERAPGPVDVCDCVYEVYTIDADELEDDFGGVFWDEGSSNLFGLRTVSEPESEFLDEFYGYIDVVTAANPFDLSVADSNAKGAKGAQVTLTVPVKNLGPADAVAFFDGPGSYGLIGELPKGLELVKVDSDGDTVTCLEPDDAMIKDSFPGSDLKNADFVCLFGSLDDGDSFDFKFTVKITDANAKGKGTLEVAAMDYDGYPGIADADEKNDKADITVNGSGSPTLSQTGSSLTMILGAAALVLVVGVVLLVVSSRRRRAGAAD